MSNSILDSCTPREDVLTGGLTDKHFAAQLDQVVANAAGYESYADADRFFDLTYPTKGLRDLLEGTFGRLSASSPPSIDSINTGGGGGRERENNPSAEHAVYRYETSFGGGKTHGLIALWHLARGARPDNLAEFVDPASIPPNCRAAAVVGDSLDPINGLTNDGITTYTLWGEIARQLGPDAWALMEHSDAARTGPGKQVWLNIFGAAPTVIIIDELAQYLRRLGSAGKTPARNLAGATIDCLKVLFEAATAAPAVRIVFTLATGVDAFRKETDELQEALESVAAEAILAEARDVMERPKGAVGRPADDHEIGFILRRRLFARVDEEAAGAALTAYKDLYSELADRSVSVGPATIDPAGYCDRIRTSYPFHPALIDCLDKRIGPLPGFQRARGALKMLAEAVRRIWKDRTALPIINLGDLPLEAEAVRASITSSIGKEALDGPAQADFAGATSNAAGVDAERWPNERAAVRACRAVFCHSVAGEPAPGAALPDIHLGVLRPGENPETVDEALAVTSRVAWHLVSDGARWRFQVEPNANRIIAAETANVSQADVTEELSRIIERLFASDGAVKAVHRPTGPADVPDEPRLRLAVMAWTDADTLTTAWEAAKPPKPVGEIADHAGVSETSRTHRNAVIALAADRDDVERMREQVRFELAAKRITRDPELLEGFSKDVRQKLKELADQASLETRVAVCRAYRHLYWPAHDPANHNLRHFELPPAQQGKTPKGTQTKVLIETLRKHGKISAKAPATDLLARAAGFARRGEMTTADLARVPWRDPSQAILLDPSLVRQTISAGIQNGAWVYYDARSERASSAGQKPPSVRVDSDAWLYSQEKARELGLLRRPVTLGLITQAVNRQGGGGEITGPALRSKLEDDIGGEPTKKEVLETLAAGLQAADPVIVIDITAEEPQPLTSGAVKRARLDNLAILNTDAAAARGISVRPLDPAPTIEGRGGAGMAFQQIADRVADLGVDLITSITIRADADPGGGTRNLRLLGLCIPQLPKFAHQVNVSITAEYRGLDGGMKAKLRGGARSYQQIENALLNLADAGEKTAGHLSVELTPAAPIRHGGKRWTELHQVVRASNPGRIVITARLTRPDGE